MSQRIFAILRNTIKSNLSTPSFFVILVLLLIIPYWCTHMAGDGTEEGKFKIFITYSFIMGTLIITVVNILLSSLSISSEWKKKTLLTLDTKPVKRWEIIMGKWLGILSINLFLILFFLLSVSFSSILLYNRLGRIYPERRDIFITYREITPFSTGEKGHPIRESYGIPPGGNVRWNFEGISPYTPELYLSYRFHTSKEEGEKSIGYWLISSSSQEAPFELITSSTHGEFHRLLLPIEAIGKRGDLSITYHNIDPENVSILFSDEDLKVRSPYGNYWTNLLRGGLNIFLIAAFISSVGILFSCLVSTLTSVLSTSFLISISYLHDFVETTIHLLPATFAAVGPEGVSEPIHSLSYFALRFIVFLFPPLNEFLPQAYIGDFLFLPLFQLGRLLLRIIILGALPILAIAMIYLSRKELGIPNE